MSIYTYMKQTMIIIFLCCAIAFWVSSNLIWLGSTLFHSVLEEGNNGVGHARTDHAHDVMWAGPLCLSTYGTYYACKLHVFILCKLLYQYDLICIQRHITPTYPVWISLTTYLYYWYAHALHCWHTVNVQIPSNTNVPSLHLCITWTYFNRIQINIRMTVVWLHGAHKGGISKICQNTGMQNSHIVIWDETVSRIRSEAPL